MLLSLFVEELGNNVVAYGFEKGKECSLELRLIHFADHWTLSLRDNGKAFDPLSWIKLHESAAPAANIGIRLVCDMAKGSSYNLYA